jgi:hypothetical protein
MSNTATSAPHSVRPADETKLRRVEHPASPLTPPPSSATIEFSANPIEFSANHGRVIDKARKTKGTRVESSARCVGIGKYFSEIVVHLSVWSKHNHAFITLGGSLKNFPNLNSRDTELLLKKSFWNCPSKTSGDASTTRQDIFNQQLAKLSKEASALALRGGSKLRTKLDTLLQDTIDSIAKRIALEVLLSKDSLAAKIQGSEK